jgi:2-desacetyl-2-hydroxyethyl bacteriochlorophyllide A dehydrogenase
MRSVVYEGPGLLALRERPRAVAGPGEVLIEVAYLGICGSDLLLWEGGLTRVAPPVTLGHEFSGTVVERGAGVEMEIGTRVAVEPLLACGECAPCLRGDENICARLRLIGIDVDGAAAQYVAVPAHRVHSIPDDLGLRAAALAEPTAVACHMVDRAGVGPASTVLIVGGGPIGALVAFVARAVGAAHVLVSEPNPERRALLSELGIETVDPTSQSVSALAPNPEGFDVSFELTAISRGLQTAIDATAPGGTVLLGGIPHGELTVSTAPAVLKELRLLGARVYRSEDVRRAIAMLASGAIPADGLITRVVEIDDAIDDAYEQLRSAPSDMKILIEPNGARP